MNSWMTESLYYVGDKGDICNISYLCLFSHSPDKDPPTLIQPNAALAQKQKQKQNWKLQQ